MKTKEVAMKPGDYILQALAELEPVESEGFTADEYAAARNMASSSARCRLTSFVKSGKVLKGRARRKDSLGRLVWLPVYRVKE